MGVGCGIALRLVVYYKVKNAKKFRQGVEYGSARWGNAKDIEPYMDSVFENNVLLTQTEHLMMSGRPKRTKVCKKKFLVIGDSGKKIFCKAEPDADALILCGHRPKELDLKNTEKIRH